MAKKRKKKVIHEAIRDVLKKHDGAMSVNDIYELIIQRQLYSFPAKDPISVVRSTIRRHCVNLEFPSAQRVKYFMAETDGRYSLLPKPVELEATAFKIKQKRKNAVSRIVSIAKEEPSEEESHVVTHNEIQWRLLSLGARLGMNVWAPNNDRGKYWDRRKIGDVSNLLDRLPHQFQDDAMRIVEYIDVLWLTPKGSLFAAFEVEHSTPIYSGLLRMADLMTLVPNQDLKWYIVSSEDRFDKFTRQVNRPVFELALKKPLHEICSFLPYNRLLQRLDEAKNLIDDLKPTFIDRVAESYDPKDAFA